MEKRRGRPKSEGTKQKRIDIRLTENEYSMLEFVCDEIGITKTEAVREALRIYYNLKKYS